MPADFKSLLDALDAEGVRYVLVGGLAAIALGGAHITDDLDVCYDRSDDTVIGAVDDPLLVISGVVAVISGFILIFAQQLFSKSRNFNAASEAHS